MWIVILVIFRQSLSDHGPSFISKLWTDLHARLGVIVSYSPIYRPAAVGQIERQHRDMKAGLTANLLEMAEEHQGDWCAALPWLILGKNTTFQPDLGATPSELVFGSNPALPGEVALPTEEHMDIPKLLAKLKANAAKKPVQTSHHSTTTPFFPKSAQNCTEVYVLKPKRSPLEAKKDGPYPITEKVGKSCVRVRVGHYANGEERTELHHWSRCTPANLADDAKFAERPALGRKPKLPDSEENAKDA